MGELHAEPCRHPESLHEEEDGHAKYSIEPASEERDGRAVEHVRGHPGQGTRSNGLADSLSEKCEREIPKEDSGSCVAPGVREARRQPREFTGIKPLRHWTKKAPERKPS